MLNASAVSIPCNLVKQASESALSWRAFDQAGTSQPDASPESPRLFGSPILPETPPAQIMKPPQTAPPVRRARSMNTPPVASHPVLASAFAVARTAAPDSDQLPARSPTQRQLQLGPLFSFPSSQTHQPTPFAFAASKLEPPSLLDKVNSLPGPKDVLQAVLLQRQNSLSCQDSGMLSHMLQRSAQLHSKRDGPAAASSTGSASSLADVSDDNASSKEPGRKAPKLNQASPPKPSPGQMTLPASPTESSSYLTSSRSAFNKSKLKHSGPGPLAAMPKQSANLPASGAQPVAHHAGPRPSQRPLDPLAQGTGETSLWKTAPALPWVGQPAPALHPMVLANLMGIGKDQGDSARAVSNSLEEHGSYTGPLSDYLAGGHRAVQHAPTGCLTRALPNSPSRHAQFDCPVNEITRFDYDSSRGASSVQVQSRPGESWPVHSSPNQQIRPAQTRAEHKAALQNSSFGFWSQRPAFHEWPLPSPSTPAPAPAGANCPKGHTSLFLQSKPPGAAGSGGQYESPPPAGQLDGRARAVQKSLECRLAFPHGTRSHKRPRLEDRLKERQFMIAQQHGGTGSDIGPFSQLDI